MKKNKLIKKISKFKNNNQKKKEQFFKMRIFFTKDIKLKILLKIKKN